MYVNLKNRLNFQREEDACHCVTEMVACWVNGNVKVLTNPLNYSICLFWQSVQESNQISIFYYFRVFLMYF